jgi:hypothetical protein
VVLFLLAAVPHDAGNYEDDQVEEEAGRKAGIYILDRSSLEFLNHVAGRYLCINSAANGDVVAAKADGRFDVFQLDDGRLIFRTSFQRHALSQIDRNESFIYLVHNSRAYVHREGPANSTEVYSIITGDLERTLWHPYQSRDGTQSALCCLVAGKKEIFCGFNSGGGIYNAFSAIKVYLLE